MISMGIKCPEPTNGDVVTETNAPRPPPGQALSQEIRHNLRKQQNCIYHLVEELG